MDFEDLQKAWKSQDAGTEMTIDADAVLRIIRGDQQRFVAMIFWRDVREVGAAVLLALFFGFRGIRNHVWTDYCVGIACLGVGTFMMVDRWLQRGNRPTATDSLKACIEHSLNQVRHQIWLLKNVFWWYLLPIIATLGLSLGASAWHARHNGGSAAISFLIAVVVCGLVYWGVYWLNQFAVRKHLEPRRQELETLLNNLK
jgi:Na+/proline symporter